MVIKLPDGLKPVWDNVLQVVIGAFLFSTVLVAVAAIGGLVRLIEYLGFSPHWFIETAEWGEKILFWLDLFVFVLFLLSETLKFIRSLYLEWTSHD